MDKRAQKNYLIITASGGNGLLQAAKAEKTLILKKDPNARIIQKDMMLDWLKSTIGRFGVLAWNGAQKTGSIFSQEILVSCQRLADSFFWPQIFLKTLNTLFKEKIDFIIDTQPIGTSAIIKAIRCYDLFVKKNIILEKILVDLPTEKSKHFFRSIKKLSQNDRKRIKVHSIEPLLENGETEEDFWQKHCKLSTNEISYDRFPIRESFHVYANKNIQDENDFVINTRVENEHEVQFIQNILKKGPIEFQKNEEGFQFKIEKEDYLVSIVLGSHPSMRSTVKYVENMIKYVKTHYNQNKNIHLFVFCSSVKEGLFEKIEKLIEKDDLYPSKLSVIPMSFQEEDVIAPLFYRSNITVTRSGGQTAMELMAVASGKICIHSECKHENPTLDQLYKGIPVWESGNARYVKEKVMGEIITPEIFFDLCREVI